MSKEIICDLGSTRLFPPGFAALRSDNTHYHMTFDNEYLMTIDRNVIKSSPFTKIFGMVRFSDKIVMFITKTK